MEGQIAYIGKVVRNRYLVTISLANNITGKAWIVKEFRNEINWKDLKVGDRVGGLIWYSEKEKLINADSPMHLLD